jgi:ribonuclease P protein component
MRSSADFALAVRRGRRVGGARVAVHLLLPPMLGTAQQAATPVVRPVLEPAPAGTPAAPQAPARVGLVVARAVGTAVVRTRVKRRLRAVAAARLSRLPAGTLAVLRATPSSANATSAELAADVDRALDRVLGAAS